MATFKLLLGLGMTVVLLGIAGPRLGFLCRVGASAQPVEPGRVGRTGDIARAEVVEVAAQKKLLRWTGPGLTHFAVFWGFLVLVLTIIEGYGALFSPTFHIPLIGMWPALGFFEDLFAVICLLAVAAFTVIRLRESPRKHGINLNRTDEALALSPDLVTAACPFCVTMLTDGVAQRRMEGAADDSVEVLDIAEVLLRSFRPDLDDASSSGATTAPTSEQ
jgi:hypothetical protein